MYINEFFPDRIIIMDSNTFHGYGKYACVKYRINKYYLKSHNQSIAIMMNSKDSVGNSSTIEDYCRFRLIG